jgi:hypothetical protein
MIAAELLSPDLVQRLRAEIDGLVPPTIPAWHPADPRTSHLGRQERIVGLALVMLGALGISAIVMTGSASPVDWIEYAAQKLPRLVGPSPFPTNSVPTAPGESSSSTSGTQGNSSSGPGGPQPTAHSSSDQTPEPIPSPDSDQAVPPSEGSGQSPSADSGQAPPAGSGQSPSAGSGQAPGPSSSSQGDNTCPDLGPLGCGNHFAFGKSSLHTNNGHPAEGTKQAAPRP